MKLQKDLREFIELLNSTKVKYLLVGGHAVAYHGFPSEATRNRACSNLAKPIPTC